MVLYLIGLGLSDPSDITVRGLEIVKQCKTVYLEAYTSILSVDKEALEEYYGREVKIADREQVECGSDELFAEAVDDDVALLVVGDPFSATTHTDLALRAHKLSIPFKVVSNASIITAIGSCGLQLYRFGETISIPFWQEEWEPESFFDKINRNSLKNLHTLCLLDIKVKEQSVENYMKGIKIYEKARYMRTHQAAQQLLAILQRRCKSRDRRRGIPQEEEEEEEEEESRDIRRGIPPEEEEITNVDDYDDECGAVPYSSGCCKEEVVITEDTLCIATVRMGTKTQTLVRGTLQEMSELDLGEPLHSLVICADLHPMEEEVLKHLVNNHDKSQKKNNDNGVFHIVGLGLGQPEDITCKGRDIVQKASKIYLEGYTSIMDGGKETLETFLQKDVIVADREMVEQSSDEILDATKNGDVVFLVVGDPLGATTHADLVLRAYEKNIPVNIIHNASILNAAGCCGLQLYSFGETVSIPYWEDEWKPDSFYDKICSNLDNGWHTLCLLDIKVKELCMKNLTCGRKVYKPPKFMSVAEAASQLVEIIKNREKCGKSIPLDCGQKVIGLARVGTNTQQLKLCSLQDIAEIDLGPPLHSLIIVGHTHPIEDEYVNMFSR